jgi:hypothetical protein
MRSLVSGSGENAEPELEVSEMKRLHIEFQGRLVKVRVTRSAHETVRLWDIIFPGQTDRRSGLTYPELRRLGEGFHDIEA